MKIIYYCSTGRHTSVFMAHIHLGNISFKKQYKTQEIHKLRYFNKMSIDDDPLLIGVDKEGNEVYTMSIPKEKEIMKKIIEGFLELRGKELTDLKMIDADTCSNPWIKLGIFLSMNTRFKGLANQLVLKGLENYSLCFLTSAHS